MTQMKADHTDFNSVRSDLSKSAFIRAISRKPPSTELEIL